MSINRKSVWQRFARSGLAADLRQYAWLIGLLAAVVLCMALGDQITSAVAR